LRKPKYTGGNIPDGVDLSKESNRTRCNDCDHCNGIDMPSKSMIKDHLKDGYVCETCYRTAKASLKRFENEKESGDVGVIPDEAEDIIQETQWDRSVDNEPSYDDMLEDLYDAWDKDSS
jgi:hypothetical protein